MDFFWDRPENQWVQTRKSMGAGLGQFPALKLPPVSLDALPGPLPHGEDRPHNHGPSGWPVEVVVHLLGLPLQLTNFTPSL